MLKYDLTVNLQPEMHKGNMKHFWRITQTNEDGTFTIRHGWSATFISALSSANKEANNLKLV
jgi:hypothetical protein